MNEYLTITQVIPRLHSSRTTVARWCRDGLLAGAVKPGHDWLVPAEALDGFVPPTPGPKPTGDRKRLLEQAQEMVAEHNLTGLPPFEYLVGELACQAGVNRERAGQALAKAIRLARKPEEKQL